MQDDSSKTSHRTVWSAAGVATAAAFYVLSFAPLKRVLQGADAPPPRPGVFSCYSPSSSFDAEHWETAYAPVMWTMDRTALRQPLLAWAGLWHVKDSLEMDSLIREFLRYEPSFDDWEPDFIDLNDELSMKSATESTAPQ